MSSWNELSESEAIDDVDGPQASDQIGSDDPDETPPLRESGHRTPQRVNKVKRESCSRSRSRTPPRDAVFVDFSGYELMEPSAPERPPPTGIAWWVDPLKDAILHSGVRHIVNRKPKYNMKLMSGCSGMLSEMLTIEALRSNASSHLPSKIKFDYWGVGLSGFCVLGSRFQ